MITKKLFGKTKTNENIYAYTITNTKGENVVILNYGGTIQSLNVKDKNGNLTDVALGYDSITEYENNSGYLGAVIGRYANRIAKGKFVLNNKKYTLYKNNGNNHLHGGKIGYDKKIWKAEIKNEKLELSLFSANMEEGYPANVNIKVTYSFDNNSNLKIDYNAISDADTIINLTNHCYFNLNGAGNGDILKHNIKINAIKFIPTDNESIPTGNIESVINTPFDFREYKEIGKDINNSNIQLKNGKGFDHNFIIKDNPACKVYSDVSGILMQVTTNKKGVQFYSGNFLNGVKGKNDKIYNCRYGFCLETQHYPDSINNKNFPSPILKANDIYSYQTVYSFSIK